MPQKTYMYDTQWNQLINAIGAGDSSAVVTALNTIKNSLDNITNAISNQTITLDFSNINSDNVSNLSDVSGNTVTNALSLLNSMLNNVENVSSQFLISNISDTSKVYAYKIGKILFVSGYIYSRQNLSAGTNIAKINANPIFEVFNCPVNDTLLKGGRFTLRTSGHIQIESIIEYNHWYSFSFVTIIN